MIGIVDYGVGNLASIRNMLRKIDVEAEIVSNAAAVARSTKLILPGIGAFDHASARLRNSGLLEVLERRVRRECIPVLGICLGFQLLTRGSEEGAEPGLGWIDADTVAFDRARLGSTDRVPHMGWATVDRCGHSDLLREMPDAPRFYFVHSYHVRCDDARHVIATARHGYEFAAGVERGNVMGVQFHPEKSHRFGMRLLQNFVQLYR
jgi:glutamine amidotransferase